MTVGGSFVVLVARVPTDGTILADNLAVGWERLHCGLEDVFCQEDQGLAPGHVGVKVQLTSAGGELGVRSTSDDMVDIGLVF